MVKLLAGIAYTLAFGLALVVAYQHTLSGEWPVVSGFIGLVIMTVLPQAGLALALWAMRRPAYNGNVYERVR